jgi:DNA-damage-inducible protein J
MASTFVQFRIDENAKNKASDICEKLGIDLPTAMRMFVSRLIRENGIPFSMKLEERSNGVDAIMAMREASSIAAQNGIADMTLDEINAEIAEARKE